MSARRRDGDERMAAATAFRLGVLTACLVTAVVVVLSVALGILVVRQQERGDRALLRQAVATADDTDDPPAGMWLAIRDGAGTETTRGIPAGLPDTAALTAASSLGRTTSTHLHVDGRDLQLLTAPRTGGAVQAVLDLRDTDALRRHVVETTIGIGLAGLLAAAAIAVVVSRRAVRPMVRALSLQRSFVADASHELRTPLTLLTTRAQLLCDAIADGESAQALADARGVVDDAGRLADVVDDLLVAADPRVDDQREPVDLTALCAEVLASAGPYAREREVATVLHGPDPVVATANRVAVRRAVLALVDNALQHAPSGGRVEVGVRQAGRAAEITVTDSGAGLDPGAAQDLFRRFASSRQSASRRHYGLGLALVRDVAVRHGGSIAVADPEEGRGARFVLRLPTAP